MASELLAALLPRRQNIDSNAVTFESNPQKSSADASHLDHLTFDAPSSQEWCKQHRHIEEDRVAELLQESLLKRGAQPTHAPVLRDTSSLITSTTESRDDDDKNALIRGGEGAQEDGCEVMRPDTSYVLPPWLEQIGGTVNIGVVGDSGTGKSRLINKLRKLEAGADGWAPVGVNETTMAPTMYPFPGETKVRLWDLPGAGTPAFPREGYIRSMGLRYFDAVLVCSACRFTEIEVSLSQELSSYSVPHFMVRTKLDMDIWNNSLDNKVGEAVTIAQIRSDLVSRGIQRPYLVSSREPRKYDMPQLLCDVFPCLRDLEESETGTAWDSAWALPEAHSELVSGVQGQWTNRHSRYVVYGEKVHVTRGDGSCAETRISERHGALWWSTHWYIKKKHVDDAWRTGNLVWQHKDDVETGKPHITWRWVG
jgi:hypothetical protein